MAAKKSNNASKKRVTFSFYSPKAEEVFVVGDFNQWNETAHPMKRDAEGVWKKAVFVAPGAYEYKFLVDGVWENDQNNNMVCENAYGSHNNIFVVE